MKRLLPLLLCSSLCAVEYRIPTWDGVKLVETPVTPVASSIFTWNGSGSPTTTLVSAFEASGAASTAQAFSIQRANHTGTQAQSTVTSLVSDLAAKEPTLTAGSSSQYYRGDKTWQTLNTGAITGFTAALSVKQDASANLTTWSGVTPGTGIAAALAINTGSAGAPVLYNGAGGTPSAITLTSGTGLPISTGVSGLGSGVATFLATPTSLNLIGAVTNETGSGALVFGTSPTIAGGTLSGSFAGQQELTAQAATNSTSTMTRGLSDTRYGQVIVLYDTTSTSAPSTTGVNSATQITLPAGTWQYDGTVAASAVSATAGCQIELSSFTGTAVMVNVTYRGSDGFFYSTFSAQTMRTDGNVNLLVSQNNDPSADDYMLGTVRGVLTVSTSQTFGFRIFQRSATDGANPAILKSGSHIVFRKVN